MLDGAARMTLAHVVPAGASSLAASSSPRKMTTAFPLTPQRDRISIQIPSQAALEEEAKAIATNPILKTVVVLEEPQAEVLQSYLGAPPCQKLPYQQRRVRNESLAKRRLAYLVERLVNQLSMRVLRRPVFASQLGKPS